MRMKPRRLLNVILIFGVVLVLILGGCGGPDPTTTPTTTQPPTTTSGAGSMDFPSGAYHSTVLLSGGVFRVAWTVNVDTISIGLKARTTGWLAIAFSPTLTKGRSDLYLGTVVSNQVNLIDSFDPGFSGGHPQDSLVGGTDDAFDISGSEIDGVTTIKFKRRLNTGDARDIVLKIGNNPFLFAIGVDDTMATEHGLVGTGDLIIEFVEEN